MLCSVPRIAVPKLLIERGSDCLRDCAIPTADLESHDKF